ncbi:MAG TPA: hypothetical protein VNN22_07140 [Verrucomicrobiae bacterium]|nr:hypothetical protein [Verrucomicrobiae bacterium]
MKTNINSRIGVVTVVSIAAVIMTTAKTAAIEYDLSTLGSDSFNVPGDVGGTAIFADNWTQPAGTGVFQPFLTLEANGQSSTGSQVVEQAFNTDGFGALYMDQQRPQWNNRVTLGDLAQVNVNGTLYYAFLLDANEPGASKSIISIDNVRIYTSAADHTAAVGSDLTQLDQLGTLRWALNSPTGPNGSWNINNWVKLDAAQENINGGASNANGGSGQSDMVLYVPVTAFAGSLSTDYLWFYNLNGAHYGVDGDLGAESGYEEWSYVASTQQIPDAASTVILLGLGLLAVECARRKFVSA